MGTDYWDCVLSLSMLYFKAEINYQRLVSPKITPSFQLDYENQSTNNVDIFTFISPKRFSHIWLLLQRLSNLVSLYQSSIFPNSSIQLRVYREIQYGDEICSLQTAWSNVPSSHGGSTYYAENIQRVTRPSEYKEIVATMNKLTKFKNVFKRYIPNLNNPFNPQRSSVVMKASLTTF